MKRIFNGSMMLAISVLLLSSASCGGPVVVPDDGDDDNVRKELQLSTKSSEFLAKGDGFSFNYLNRVDAASKTDYVISPLSMQFLLGMILNGTKGETASQISSVLGYGAGETDAVNDFCLSMLTQLPTLDKKTTLKIADAIYVDDGYPLKDAYKKAVTKYYDAGVSNLDFRDTKGSAAVINKWCSDHTNGMIDKILDEVSPDMLAYLLNAVYFKSEWSVKFNKASTATEAFTDEAGTAGKVSMMKQHTEMSYLANDKLQAVRLPYGNGAFAMTVLLPKKGTKVADITASLAKDGLKGLGSFYTKEVDLWLPKFKTKFHINLNDILAAMGMPLAFTGAADFSPMSQYALCLSFVNQDAVIEVDEEGTEAAAISSAGVMKNTSTGSSSYLVFHADHPFIYLITEASSGAVLFAGRYSGK